MTNQLPPPPREPTKFTLQHAPALFAQGLNNHEIAKALQVSKDTVRNVRAMLGLEQPRRGRPCKPKLPVDLL